ncbi:GPO family capsid scaffolding protein [Psychromonas aquimarina]|uniref:GPO family capsid scaffolding protein n=1 Tax=Psychromonas aquimarina TaxID=444919 RepID=UPI0004219359|nr:GPO family capsid scaffolding protein [Psychromonas aquimarina]
MFQTKYICILTAGHTVDGREVTQETVDQCAETYSPDTYNARININHRSYGSKVGSVLAVKAEGPKLLAQLKPNDLFLHLIQQGQYLHTSCEIQMDFAKTGKAYLTGLALTDEPASLGTDELHLSAKHPGTELLSSNEMITPEKPSLLNKLFANKDDDMTDKATLEMFSQINETNAKTASALTALTGSIGTLTEKLSVKPNQETEAPQGGNADTEAVAELTEKLSALTSTVESQQTEIGSLTEKLSKQTDEPERDQATGGNGLDQDDVL